MESAPAIVDYTLFDVDSERAIHTDSLRLEYIWITLNSNIKYSHPHQITVDLDITQQQQLLLDGGQ